MAQRSQPWDEPTVTAPLGPPVGPPPRPAGYPGPNGPAYRPGVAPVDRSHGAGRGRSDDHGSDLDPTLTGAGWTEVRNQPRPPLRYQARQLKRGWEWSNIGALFLFVAWGIWAFSERLNGLAGPVLTLLLVLLVAAGVFALCRLLGRMILERTLGRNRHTAWPSHLVTGVFLAAAGVQFLSRTEWVVETLTWLRSLR